MNPTSSKTLRLPAAAAVPLLKVSAAEARLGAWNLRGAEMPCVLFGWTGVQGEQGLRVWGCSPRT